MRRFLDSELGGVAVIAAQFILVVLVLVAFKIETEPFRQLMILSAAAFPIHHVLPSRFRMPFFALLSIGGILLAVGLSAGAWVVGIGVVFLGLCHVPAPYPVRVGLVVAWAGVLAAGRVEWYTTPWSTVTYTLLGSMIMFRLIIYLYDLKHSKQPANVWRSLAYFFMMPNVCFPMFPVVDYATFARTHYNKNAIEIYKTGIQWLFRGAFQLLLYRLVYLYVSIDPMDVQSLGSLFRFMVATYLLYLNISGTFHIIAGILHLFGFNLPETHHLYLLASSFSDFWRRINIYWKDFILKLFYYPILFRLRRYGETKAMLIATAFAFFATWVLHAYQWFWLRGTILFTGPDTLFWGILGALVVVNSYIEARNTGKKTLTNKNISYGAKLGLAVRTVLTFISLVLLWSLWTAESLGEWWALLGHAVVVRPADLLLVGGVLGAVGVSAVIFGGSRRLSSAAKTTSPALSALKASLAPAAIAPFLLVLSLNGVQKRLPETIRDVAIGMEGQQLSERDMAKLQRGYYEELTRVDRFSHELAALYGKRPPDYFDPWRAAMIQPVDTLLRHTLAPLESFDYLGAHYSTNQWGMRDKEYAKEKPAGTYRIAIVGASQAMGWGVSDDDTFESQAERRLNETSGAEGMKWEILNFSVDGYGPVQKLMLMEDRVLDFKPDTLMYECTSNEIHSLVKNLADAVELGIPIPYEFYAQTLSKAGIDSSMERAAVEVKLAALVNELVGWTYKRVADTCRERGIHSILMFVPHSKTWYDKDIPSLLKLAKEANFDETFDLSEAFKGVPSEQLILNDWDFHPNPRGHKLLADTFFKLISSDKSLSIGERTLGGR